MEFRHNSQTENQGQFRSENLKAKDNFGFLPRKDNVKTSSSVSATTLEAETIPISIRIEKDIRVVYSNTIFNAERLLERPKQKQKDKTNDVDIGTRSLWLLAMICLLPPGSTACNDI